MPFRIGPTRALRLLPRPSLNLQCLRAYPRIIHTTQQYRNLTNQNPNDEYPMHKDRIAYRAAHQAQLERARYYKRRTYYSGAGIFLAVVATWITAMYVDKLTKPTKLDSGRRADDPLVVIGKERKVVVQKLGEEPEEIVDTVETGTSTVPTFPRILDFLDDDTSANAGGAAPGSNQYRAVEYQLLGLGIRTVSFLGIQVYVVGMYVATEDIATLQEALIREIDPIASTLVAGEKDKLKAKLYDPQEGVEIWDNILKKSGVRTLVRIVPTRNTDFHHLRDAWVRLLTARAQAKKEEFGDEKFGTSLGEFKQLFNRGSVPKGKELLLSRDSKGKFVVWYDDGKVGATRLGQVVDERISRPIWLNYIAGKIVASEGARKSIIDGVMEFVERPVGTVATQVV